MVMNGGLFFIAIPTLGRICELYLSHRNSKKLLEVSSCLLAFTFVESSAEMQHGNSSDSSHQLTMKQ